MAFAWAAAAHLLGVPAADPRHPDVVAIVQHGVVYTGGTSKIAKHGGADADDRDVPLLVSSAAGTHGLEVSTPVDTTSIAPTVLRLLGLNPRALQAVREQHTPVLPNL